MVRKISAIVCTLVLICALCTTAQASTHEVYEGGPVSTTYITYFRDIISGLPHHYDYVPFRSGQNSYSLVVSNNFSYDGFSTFSANNYGDGYFVNEYRYYSDGTGYSSNYQYECTYYSEFEVNTGSAIIYSSMGQFPRLTNERSDSIELLSACILVVMFFTNVISRFFISSKRRSR